MTGELFDAELLREPAPIPAPPATAGQRLIARQRGAIAVGMHPLSLTATPTLRLHADAQREIGGDGPRCGTCRYRHVVGGAHAGRFPKCLWPDPDDQRTWRRVSNGSGTDVRRGWPACVDYEPAVADAG